MAKRCDLLLALSDALVNASEADRVINQTAPQALKLANPIG